MSVESLGKFLQSKKMTHEIIAKDTTHVQTNNVVQSATVRQTLNFDGINYMPGFVPAAEVLLL